jgi:hypothetical protein
MRNDTRPDHAQPTPSDTTSDQINNGDGVSEPHRRVLSGEELEHRGHELLVVLEDAAMPRVGVDYDLVVW